MRKEQSNLAPMKYLIELDEISARIALTDPQSVVETTDAEGNTLYEYQTYIMFRPYRESLANDIAEHFADWLALAKAEDATQAAAEMRAKRDALLKDTDHELSLDRMGLEVPTGATISSWLSFLKRLGEMVTGAWAKYRQALRDLPQAENWPYLTDEDWPTMPSDE